ncbi:hypothetical protein [Moraxella oblonga]|uniref:hypothetical protein n=1 Tax=Moraxella oblonga TaxID=200413 RepID=UPI00082A077B|nr:hypothetical protein [Moraxella oblonga]
MNVEFLDSFKTCLATFDDETRQAILTFVFYVRQHGLKGLTGRNKSSVPINPRTKKEQANFEYAQKHCLWHYHIGIPHYVGDDGDKTSQYILHYQRFDDRIVLLALSAHPPFVLPNVE